MKVRHHTTLPLRNSGLEIKDGEGGGSSENIKKDLESMQMDFGYYVEGDENLEGI